MASSGTRWLHDQLASHSDVWLPYRKELHFFNRGIRFMSARRQMNTLVQSCTTRHKLPNLLRHRSARLGLHPYDDTQIHFLCEYLFGSRSPHLAEIERATQPRRDARGGLSALIDNPGLEEADFEQYRRLFGYHDRSRCGEITPAYSYLAPGYIRQICVRFPATRFILVVRDPVDRQISSWKKRVRKGREPDLAPDSNEAKGPRKTETGGSEDTRADPCRIEDRWLAETGRERLLTIRFDDIVDRPATVRRQLADFLELPRGERGFRIRADYNRKRRSPSSERASAETINAMRSHFSERLWDAHQRYLERFG